MYFYASAAAGVNFDGIKTPLAGLLSTFFIKAKAVFSNDQRSFPKSPPNCTILPSQVFNNLMLADELFAKALQS